ncbi:helicase protein MOM1-like isoform X2 [Solanum dulcamara]|uniref:helicase protein MOM1-like isoform X2 n=1 Tax=Solanum dulcamara TaxID=45834 RepID=UPI0024858686|nr:helicase protein MOM1-like isoform X2 [Solanum dulcamara]
MAIDAGSGSKSRDNDSNNSKNKLVSKGSSSCDSGKADRSTRSSVKETLSKQMDLSPASTRKSERLEKRTPPIPPAKKKSAGLEQQNTPSPLRRSERCSTSSRSKYIGRESNSSSIKEEKREKIVKKLTIESDSVSTTTKNATTPVDLKRKKMDDRTYKLLFKKQKKEDIASDACEDDGTDGKHGSKSQPSLLHEADLVEPEERRMLYNEQKSLHIHLKAEIAKLFGVIKVSEVIKHTAEKFLEYIMENHRVSREPETILQAFQISLSWTAASILKEKIDKDDIFLLVKQQLQFRCTKEEAINVYLKLRSLKKMFLRRLDQSGNASSSSYEESISQAAISARLNVDTDIVDRLQDNELSGEGTVTPTEKLRDSQREKFIKEVQCGHGKRMSMLEQEEHEKIEEFNRIWEKKKEVLEEECRLEIAVLRAIHGETAATKDRQKSLATKFAKKIEVHTHLKDQQLKELEAKYSAMRNEEMQKVSSQQTREKSSGRGHYSGDEMECSQENFNVSDSIPKTAVSGLQGDMAASDAPASSPDACHVLPIQSTNVLATSVSEELAEITSTGRESVAAVKQSNEAGNSGGSEEEIACKVPLSPKEHTGKVASDKRSRICLEVSEVALNEAVGHDKISEVNNTIQELVTENNSFLPNVVGNQRVKVSSSDGNQITPEELPAELPCVAAVPSSDDASSLPQNPVNLDDCYRSSGDNGTHNNLLGENQIGMQTELVSGHNINNTSEAILAGNCEQHHRVDDGVPIAAHHTHRESQTHNERNPIPIPGSSPHAAGPSHQAVSSAGVNLEPCASVQSDVRVTHSQSFLPAVSRVHPQSTTNSCGSSKLPVRPAHQMATCNLALPFHADSLHIEWERIHKEKEQVTNGLEDMKLHLRSECKKEIEEAIAPIRKKYDLKLQEVEAAYLLKKKELDMNQNKILMNKALADAFRFIFMDVEISDLPVVPPGYMLHPHQVRQQQSLRSSPINGSSSARQPVEAQTTVSSSPVANCSVHSVEAFLPPLRSSSVAGSSSCSQPAAVSRSTTFSAGSVSRPPPLISTITPSRGNHQLGGEVRAPAPHLQRFKGPTSTPVSSSSTLLNGMPGHPRPIYVAASLRSTLQNPIQPPIVQQLPVNLSDSGNTSLDHGLGGLPAIQNPSLSARELLQEMENRSRANKPNFMPPLPDIGCNFDSLDLSDFHSMGSVQRGSISSEPATNVPVRKKNKRLGSLTDQIVALQKLVSPDGKAGTASVLHEAYNSITSLKNQIQDLCNTASNNGSLFLSQNSRRKAIDVQSGGFCLVPVSLVQKLIDEDVYHVGNSFL